MYRKKLYKILFSIIYLKIIIYKNKYKNILNKITGKNCLQFLVFYYLKIIEIDESSLYTIYNYQHFILRYNF